MSANDYKRSQFEKYKSQITESQKHYANICKADYNLFETDITDYDKVQFKKILLLEELSNDYDEILYFDFDVVPQTNKIFFDDIDENLIASKKLNFNTFQVLEIDKFEKFLKSLR